MTTATTLDGVLLKGVAGSRPAANAVAKGTIYSATDTGAMTQSDGVSTWSTFATIGSGITDPTTTNGDLIARIGGVLARLGIGNAGGHLASINGALAYDTGTSFPGSKATNDRYFRTDILGGTMFLWDGTRWVSDWQREPLIMSSDTSIPFTGTATTARNSLGFAGAYDIWVMSIYCATFVNGTNDGTHNWTVAFQRDPSATSLGSFSTSADSASTWTFHTITVNALTGTSDKALSGAVTKVSTAGNLYATASVVYRIVAT